MGEKNLQQLTPDEERVNADLEKIPSEASERVAHLAKTRKVLLRTAACRTVVGRVAKARTLRGRGF